MKKEIAGVTLEVVQGDIAKQEDVVAIVNAANAQLKTGGGVAGAIHRAAGPELAKECQPLAPIEPGEAVITGAHNLPNQYVIHCLGPVYGRDEPAVELLADCYRNSLQLAEEKKITSLAFPAISTGTFGYPLNEATEVVFTVISELIANLNQLNKIRFVLFSDSDFETYKHKLSTLTY
ncbi:macro domain-containing protein [Fuchsiella alkaliacetigena]|uniref:macro domain-containing protein n=1 Tax=Fuchsiella alkaliacetigena TaxID=957042 RepID=UPI00200A2F1F|nr:macro domain-containing protein [Fuchsiella alkaliacetigena]MCK8823960.1 macro domain-containing protein [Fuchsiella alkaliacetigena]